MTYTQRSSIPHPIEATPWLHPDNPLLQNCPFTSSFWPTLVPEFLCSWVHHHKKKKKSSIKILPSYSILHPFSLLKLQILFSQTFIFFKLSWPKAAKNGLFLSKATENQKLTFHSSFLLPPLKSLFFLVKESVTSPLFHFFSCDSRRILQTAGCTATSQNEASDVNFLNFRAILFPIIND